MVYPANAQMVMFEQEFRQVSLLIEKLTRETNSKASYLIDKNGQMIACAGDTVGIDSTSLASLTAGNIAATTGLAKLLGEQEFSILFHEGEKDNIHISMVGQRVILVVIFDRQSSLGLVRLRVKKMSAELSAIFDGLAAKAQSGTTRMSPFEEITDQDIDKLFVE